MRLTTTRINKELEAQGIPATVSRVHGVLFIAYTGKWAYRYRECYRLENEPGKTPFVQPKIDTLEGFSLKTFVCMVQVFVDSLEQVFRAESWYRQRTTFVQLVASGENDEG